MAEKSGITHVVPKAESWRVSDVSYRKQNGTYEIIGKMTSRMSQDGLAEKYGLEIPSAPLIWAIATRAYDLRTQNPEAAESLKNFLEQGFGQALNTSTRTVYNPYESDEIIHDYGTSESYSLTANVVGPNSWIKEMSDKKILESLLGTSDVSKINSVAQWINGTEVYLWRLNSKPSKKEEVVVRFDASGYRFCLYYNWSPLGEFPAFRVLRID